ncbi:hypothetical protein [Claveliimonas bilis]|uniref:Transposase n=1 Tax=Claveliimonas bilis TaxID=3028070 RepID=A0ABN6YV48_9FIRM|nr:hypothetical protein [Claveliimonas bilis]BDZ77062.1 hypothetical protein Lac1_12450 [Claveliimonas bilis]BDZ79015.1 hypothetical protein Lac3_02240 [Claveliimonas bilis]
METVVQREEILYRVIKRSQPDTVDNNGHPTSALFKQEDGVSVDRDGERRESTIIETFKNRFEKRFKGLVKVQASVCIDNAMAVIPETKSNIYHAEIFENTNKEPLTQLKALILADSSEMVVYDSSVEWR